jgi:hypothetical protein
LHCIIFLNVVPVAGATHIHNILLIHDSRRAIVSGCSSKVVVVCYCLSSSICGANNTRKSRNLNVGRKGSPGLNLNGVGRAHGGLNNGRVRGGDLNDGRVCSNGHNIMDSPDVATEGLDAPTNDPGVTTVRSRGRNLCPSEVCLVVL